jgi:hypothetical protein
MNVEDAQAALARTQAVHIESVNELDHQDGVPNLLPQEAPVVVVPSAKDNLDRMVRELPFWRLDTVIKTRGPGVSMKVGKWTRREQIVDVPVPERVG